MEELKRTYTSTKYGTTTTTCVPYSTVGHRPSLPLPVLVEANPYTDANTSTVRYYEYTQYGTYCTLFRTARFRRFITVQKVGPAEWRDTPSNTVREAIIPQNCCSLGRAAVRAKIGPVASKFVQLLLHQARFLPSSSSQTPLILTVCGEPAPCGHRQTRADPSVTGNPNADADAEL